MYPSKEINEQFVPTFVKMKNGDVHTGVVVNLNGDRVTLNTDLYNPNQRTSVVRSEIESMGPSPVSPMPPGLLNMMEKDEIMDLLAEPEDEMTKMIMNARSAKRDQPVTSQHISRMKTQLNALCQILIQLTSIVADRVDRRLVKSTIPQNTNLMDVVGIMKRVVENRDTERNIRTQLKELPITIWTRKQRELAHKRVMSGVAEKLHGFHVRPRGVNVQSLFECKAVDDVRDVMEDINGSLRSNSSISEIDWIAHAIHKNKTTHKPWFDTTLCLVPKRKRKPKKVRRWNEEEDTLLIQAVKRYGTGRRAYDQMIENLIPCRKRTTVRDRIRALKSKNSDTGRRMKSALVGMPWTKEDDEVLLSGIKKYVLFEREARESQLYHSLMEYHLNAHSNITKYSFRARTQVQIRLGKNSQVQVTVSWTRASS